MYRPAYFRMLLGTLCLLAACASNASADNGTVVAGTVIGIDVVNQIMRVQVASVNGQVLFGNPQNNFVDYLVAPTTVVIGPNNQFVGQANVVIGSRIQMQFAGPLATTIVLVGNNNGGLLLGNNNGGIIPFLPVVPNYGTVYFANYGNPIRTVPQQFHVTPQIPTHVHPHHVRVPTPMPAPVPQISQPNPSPAPQHAGHPRPTLPSNYRQ